MYCGINGRAYFREKSTLCNNFIQKGGWAYFQGWAYFREITLCLEKYIRSWLKPFLPTTRYIYCKFHSGRGLVFDWAHTHTLKGWNYHNLNLPTIHHRFKHKYVQLFAVQPVNSCTTYCTCTQTLAHSHHLHTCLMSTTLHTPHYAHSHTFTHLHHSHTLMPMQG